MELEPYVAVKGVTCHQCKEFVRGGKTYYKKFWYDYHMQKYHNFCVACAAKVAAITILKAQDIAVISRELNKKYKSDDRKLCLTCKNKYKQVVGECSPTQSGCKWKPIKEKKNDNKNSKAV